MKYLFFFLLLIGLASCDKTEMNERKLAGIWEGKTVEYQFYNSNNELIKDSTVANSGALYLWDDDELDNQWKSSLSIVPNFTNTWAGDPGKKNVTLMGLTIRKLTRRKMELVATTSDTNLNLVSSTIYYFERQ